MQCEKPPTVCPRCGSSHTARLIWGCVHLCGEDEEDVRAGRAIVVNPQGTQTYEPWQALMRRRSGELPRWACLDCAPGWSEVHEMAIQDYRRQIDKEDAVATRQFDRAAELKD